mgnify:CR=1 FL=1
MNKKVKNLAKSKIQLENDLIKITKYSFSPFSETKMHTHIWDYIVVPITSGNILMISHEGQKSSSKLEKGVSYFRKAGVKHNVINNSKTDLIFIEIELKKQSF